MKELLKYWNASAIVKENLYGLKVITIVPKQPLAVGHMCFKENLNIVVQLISDNWVVGVDQYGSPTITERSDVDDYESQD